MYMIFEKVNKNKVVIIGITVNIVHRSFGGQLTSIVKELNKSNKVINTQQSSSIWFILVI
jgi:hypothetical protein